MVDVVKESQPTEINPLTLPWVRGKADNASLGAGIFGGCLAALYMLSRPHLYLFVGQAFGVIIQLRPS